LNEETKINVDEELKNLSKKAYNIKYVYDKFIQEFDKVLENTNDKKSREKLIDKIVLRFVSRCPHSEDLMNFYQILKKHNLEKRYEDVIITKIAKEIIKIAYFPFEKNISYLEEVLRNYINSDRELVEKVVKVLVKMFVYDVINDIPIWLRNYNMEQHFIEFLIIIKSLRNLNLDNIVKEEIEIFKNALNIYKNDMKKAIKRRIRDYNREEMNILIELLEDRKLYKYLL